MTRFQRTMGVIGTVALLVGPVSVLLLQRASTILDRPLADDRTGAPPEPVPVGTAPGRFQAPLWKTGYVPLADTAQIEVLVATYGTRPRVTAARLQFGSCEFTLREPMAAADGQTLPLHRVRPCQDDAHVGVLDVELSTAGQLSLWTWQMPNDQSPRHAGVTLTDPAGPSATRSIIRGRKLAPVNQPAPRRAALVAWLWGDPGRGYTGLVLIVSALLVAFGVFGLAQGAARPWGLGLAAGVLAVGLSTMWAAVVPPLQGPDEPDHLLSFGEVAGRKDLAESLPASARAVHFERIRFHRDEWFSPMDRNTEYAEAWTGDIHAERMEARSPVAAAVWEVAALAADTPSPLRVLWRLRLIDAAVFGAAVGLAVWLLVRAGRPVWQLAGLALMPTVPFFATMLSDWALAVSFAIVTTAGWLLALTDHPTARWGGLVAGVGLALLGGTTLASLTLAPLWLVLTVGWILLRPARASALWFWGGLAIGLLLTWVWLGDLAASGYQRYDAEGRPAFAALLQRVNAGLRWITAAPWLLLVLPLAGFIIDRACNRLRTSPWCRRVGTSTVRALAALAAVVAVGQLAASLIVPMPTLPTLETRALVSVGDYVRDVVMVVGTAARLQDFDHLTFTSLWGAFGWIDTILPPAMLASIVVLLVAGLAGLWRCTEPRVQATGVLALAGGAAGVVTIALAAALMQRNVHGRYLILLAVPVVTLSMAAASARVSSAPPWMRVGVAWTLAALHGMSLWWVAARYYGHA